MFKHWRFIIGLLWLVKPIWDGIKWILDWFGRFDLIASHLHDFGVQAVIDFILSPPAWTVWPSIVIGGLFVWWDLKRKEAAELELNQKLWIGFIAFCAAIGIGVWVMALALYFPAPAKPAPVPTPKPVSTPTPAPKPTPTAKPPWVTTEEIEDQRKLGRTLLIYSPQELAILFSGGQDLSAYTNNWIKVDNAITALPTPETIDKKEYYAVAVDIEVIASNGVYRMKAYFDSKIWGSRLIGLRKGSKLKAACVFQGFERRQLPQYASYYDTILLGYNCDLT